MYYFYTRFCYYCKSYFYIHSTRHIELIFYYFWNMDKVQYYKDRFSSRTDDQLKDIIAGSLDNQEIEAITAALQLLKERQPQTPIPLKDIPHASKKQLKEIVANPDEWGQSAVTIAKRTLLRLEHKPLRDVTEMSKSGKAFSGFLIVFAIFGALLFLLFFGWLFLFIFAGGGFR